VLIIAGVVAYTILGPQRLPAPPINIAYRGETWTGFRPEVFDYTIEGDSLRLTLKTVARWAGNGQGGLVYRDVVGNFKATANVYARKGGDPNQVVSTAVSLGGLSARDPNGTDRGGTEDYVHIVTGNTPSGIGVETKNNVNGVTAYEAVPGPSADAGLRICRIGADFNLYKRPTDGGTWTLAATYTRPDLPETLQVGANIYAVVPPDLQVRFENLRIEPVVDKADCERD